MVRAVTLKIVVCFLMAIGPPLAPPHPTAHWRRRENDVLVDAWVSPGFGFFPAPDW